MRRLFLAAVAGLIGVTCAEALLRLTERLSPSVRVLLAPPSRQPREIEDPAWIFRPNPAIPGSDADGYRNPGIPGRAEIVALGDSQTYGTSVAVGQEWPRQLERRLGASTYNLAYPGFGPVHSRLQLERALALRPRVLLVAIYSGNDLFDAYRMTYERGHFPELRSRDEQLLAALRARDAADPIAKAPPKRPPPGGFLVEHSRVVGLLRAWRRLASASRASSWEAMRERVKPGSAEQLFERGGLRTVLSPKWRLRGLDPGDPRIREGERITLESVTQICGRAGAAQTACVAVLIPSKELVACSLTGAPEPRSSPELRELVASERQLWARLTTALAQREIATVETLASLREAAARQPPAYGQTWDGHPAAPGHAAIARAVAARLEDLGLRFGGERVE